MRFSTQPLSLQLPISAQAEADLTNIIRSVPLAPPTAYIYLQESPESVHHGTGFVAQRDYLEFTRPVIGTLNPSEQSVVLAAQLRELIHEDDFELDEDFDGKLLTWGSPDAQLCLWLGGGPLDWRWWSVKGRGSSMVYSGKMRLPERDIVGFVRRNLGGLRGNVTS